MATIPQPFLFSWKEIDEASDLDRLRLVLGTLPDEALVSFLEERRGRGPDDYPIRPMWNAVIAGIVFQHPSAAALLRELRRNGEMRQLCGFNPFGGEKSAPSDDAMERFLKLIVEHIARHTDKWQKAYDRRTSVERVNSRIDQVLGFERHTIRGKAKMKMRVTIALVVMLAMALGRIRAGQSEKLRSLTAPVARAA